mgnify:CR=1 FL=1
MFTDSDFNDGVGYRGKDLFDSDNFTRVSGDTSAGVKFYKVKLWYL